MFTEDLDAEGEDAADKESAKLCEVYSSFQ